jgi:hypothetical protein
MTGHQITVNGDVYHFELHSHASGPKVQVDAPGVAAFDVEEPNALAKARDILRSLYDKRARG